MVNKEVKITSSIDIEVQKGERRYVFSIPAGSPFGESYDVAIQAMDVIRGWAEQSQAKIKESRPADIEEPVEIVKDGASV